MFKYVQIVYALSPRDPDCLHWPLICQDLLMEPWTLYKAIIALHPDPRIKTLSGWVKVTKVTETWECCSFELWMIRGTRPELPSLDAAVSPRQGDDGYRIDHRYHISQNFPGVEDSSERSWPIFKIFHALSPRDPDCLHWPLICQELLMDPEHCTRQYPCILIPEPFQDQWRWRKWRKFGSVAHSNFGWYEVLVGNCHLLMQLSSHVKVMMDIHNRSSISYLTKFPRCWRRSWLYSKFPCPFTSRSRLFALTTDLPEMEKRGPHFSSATPYDRHQFGLGQWRSLRIGWLVEWTLRDLWTDLSHHFINGVHPSQASLQSTAFSWQESQYHKYRTILYLFQWQGPYRYCVRLEGCSGGVGAHCTTPAGDAAQLTVRRNTNCFYLKMNRPVPQQHCNSVPLQQEWKNTTDSETWVSCANLNCTEIRVLKRVGKWVAVDFKLHLVAEAVSANPGNEFSSVLSVSFPRGPAKLCPQAWSVAGSKCNGPFPNNPRDGRSKADSLLPRLCKQI